MADRSSSMAWLSGHDVNHTYKKNPWDHFFFFFLSAPVPKKEVLKG